MKVIQLKSDLRGIETQEPTPKFGLFFVLKSDLRGIETSVDRDTALYTVSLKSDLRGIETLLLSPHQLRFQC